ncbi:hypothetical protein E4T80_00245 [Muribacter muris]|uniref:Transferrin-binding protein B C-lobe/N-lobe beta-barrel domain-containing protein n=1 Tax=Muribacter muris TaxID=67855 RepID=A0A4Y9K9B1_9PAST|nr:transferrin-binding protein-like solute binding protein [Muribacter muris]MBF0783911.1 transferrin-binding protein-like solute binding protein [Muribacter muris]MBF0826409.1 transferrin-binding protein-like solute binding protein [Muribacter muris]TFV13307.1 hypothetical protein E4T80_00245 [Muribacter muris]
MKKQLSILACAVLLSACGSSSGGSSSNDAAPKASTPKPSVNQETPNKGVQNQNTASPFYSLNGKGNIEFKDTNNIHQLTVNGQTIDLANIDGASVNGWKTEGFDFFVGGKRGSSDISVYTSSPNVTVGIMRSNDVFAFVNGKATDVSQLPTGVVTYNVKTNSATMSDFGIAHGKITANFADKTLSGTLTNDIKLNAKIDGNKFASENGAATQVKGGFFGENAKEIGGIYKTNERVGAFAGQAQ